jgi:hypothetical protein
MIKICDLELMEAAVLEEGGPSRCLAVTLCFYHSMCWTIFGGASNTSVGMSSCHMSFRPTKHQDSS